MSTNKNRDLAVGNLSDTEQNVLTAREETVIRYFRITNQDSVARTLKYYLNSKNKKVVLCSSDSLPPGWFIDVIDKNQELVLEEGDFITGLSNFPNMIGHIITGFEVSYDPITGT